MEPMASDRPESSAVPAREVRSDMSQVTSIWGSGVIAFTKTVFPSCGVLKVPQLPSSKLRGSPSAVSSVSLRWFTKNQG